MQSKKISKRKRASKFFNNLFDRSRNKDVKKESTVGIDFEKTNRKQAKKGRKYRKWLKRIILIGMVAGVGVGIYNSSFIQSLIFQLRDKINEMRHPLPELTETVEPKPSYSELMARTKQAFIIIGMVALILISIQNNYKNSESQGLIEASKDITTDEVVPNNLMESKTRRQQIGIFIQWGTWIGNILSSYSLFWCSCFSHLRKIIPGVTVCIPEYWPYNQSGCPELCHYLSDCILSGRPIQMLYPYFMMWIGSFYNPMLGIFGFLG